MLVILSPNYRFHHPHPSSPFGFIICIRVIMAFAKAVKGRREIRIFLSNHWHILVRKWLQQYRIIFVVTLIACVRFGTVENVEAFHKAADHILTHGEWNVKLHCIWGRNSLDILLQCTGRLAQELWRMAHGAKVGAQQRSSACEDSEKWMRSSDAQQYWYWAPVLEKFVKGTAAGHLVNLTNPVAQDFGAQALCREHMHDIAADYCSSTWKSILGIGFYGGSLLMISTWKLS